MEDNTVQYIKIGNVTTTTQSTADEIYRQINLLPPAHRSIIEKEVKEIRIVSEGTSCFNRATKVMNILENPDPREVIHECAHVIEEKLGLINGENEKYNTLRESVVKGKGYKDVRLSKENYAKKFLRLQSDTFVSEYQGCLYSGGKEGYELIIDGQVNPKCLVEYFPEGYSFYLTNPELLKERDRELFDFIKELTGG